jgi:hypothetical protein
MSLEGWKEFSNRIVIGSFVASCGLKSERYPSVEETGIFDKFGEMRVRSCEVDKFAVGEIRRNQGKDVRKADIV